MIIMIFIGLNNKDHMPDKKGILKYARWQNKQSVKYSDVMNTVILIMMLAKQYHVMPKLGIMLNL